MLRRIPIVLTVWAVVAGGFALSQLPNANADSTVLVAVISVAGPIAAFTAAWLVRMERHVLALVGTTIALVTPTYALWPLSLIPLTVALVIGFSLMTRRSAEAVRT